MKKVFALMTAILMLFGLAACSQDSGTGENQQQITMGAQSGGDAADSTEPLEETGDAIPATTAGEEGVYAFAYNGVQLQPGTAFDAAALPAPASTYTVPSCALEGTDNVYNYETFEVTAYDEGNGEFIYSVYFIDPNLTTPEGLALGDDLSRAIDLYGDDYVQADTAYTYTKTNTQLVIIVQNDVIVSIEYRLVTE